MNIYELIEEQDWKPYCYLVSDKEITQEDIYAVKDSFKASGWSDWGVDDLREALARKGMTVEIVPLAEQLLI